MDKLKQHLNNAIKMAKDKANGESIAMYSIIEQIELAQQQVKLFDLPVVSQQRELLKFLNWLDAQYHDKHYPNINEGIVDNYIKNFNCG